MFREEKQRTRSKTATSNHRVRVQVSFIVLISVWHMAPHSLPLAHCDIPICCNPHSTHSLHLHPAVRCRLSFTASHVTVQTRTGKLKYLSCLFLKFNLRTSKYWMFPHLHTEATGQSKACEPLSLVSAASTDKRAL